MNAATGHYLNLYEENGKDVFLVFNEPCSEPTQKDLEKIIATMEAVFDSFDGNECEALVEELENAIIELDCECLDFGFQIVVKRFR